MAKGEVLILHHVEPMWESCFDSEYLTRVATHLRRARYDRVIYTTIEGDRPEDATRHTDHYYHEFCLIAEALRWHRVVSRDWTYSWEPDPAVCAEQYNLPVEDFITFPEGHGIAYLYPWLKELRGSRVVAFGGQSEECLADLLVSLRHLAVSHRTIRGLNY